MSLADELDICPACCGSGYGTADTLCYRCNGTGGVPRQSSPPAVEGEIADMLETARELIHEAKGADGPNGGFVTDHLDFAESWIGKAQDAATILSRQLTIAQGEAEALREHIAEQAAHAETRIQDGIEMGAAVWRIALEDIARENRAFLTPDTEGAADGE